MNNSKLISQRALALKPSMTLEISALAQRMKKEGKDICSLSAGEPDFATPDFIVEAAIKALKDGITRYGPAAGDPELREAIAQKLTKSNNIPTKINNVLVTNGGKQAIFNLFQVLLDDGDEVIIPSPYWLSYPEIAKLANAKPVYIYSSASNGFQIDLDKLEEAITPRTKLLILNYPSNPTGQIITESVLNSLSNIIRKHPQVFIMSDEIYEFLISNDSSHISIGEVAPDLLNRIFIVNGFAKGWAMTGWRIGYLSGPEYFINKAIALQSQSTSNVCSFAQRGALEALNNSRDCVKKMSEIYNSRREILINGLKNIEGINLIEPKGAFYAFPELDNRLPASIEFSKMALEREGLAVVPGIAFGEDRCIRISCAVANDVIFDGLKRLESLIQSILLS